MFYREWGFHKNPFDTHALPPNEEGDLLLVGRDVLARMLVKRLSNPAKIPTVEGLNGVGKTSLINVAVFRSYCDAIRSNVQPLFIPCETIFQLGDAVDPDEFRLNVLLEVAQTLIKRHAELPPPRGKTRLNKHTSIDRFINSAQVRSFGAGLSGFSGSFGQETNTGIGFEKSGLERAIRAWLDELFPTPQSGGVVCILDNLELLQTSEKARIVVESLRDTLFSINGVRFVLCGALNIVNGIASSPRMDGRLQRPIVVEDLDEEYAGEVFQKRITTFRISPSARLPISQANFVELYDIMRGNIRSVLSECDEFCTRVADVAEDIEDFDAEYFDEWLEEELVNVYIAVRAEVRPAAMKLFKVACQLEAFSPGDHQLFGYAKPSAMRPQIKVLEDVGLLVSSIDEQDKRRKTIQVTSKGWKLRAYLDYFEPSEDGW
jgi:hypothetical protein